MDISTSSSPIAIPHSSSTNDATEPSSFLSLLSMAAANAQPIPLNSSDLDDTTMSVELSGRAMSIEARGDGKNHRRLSSTGKARRRLSDARDAATRPSAASLSTPTSFPLHSSSSMPISSTGLSIPASSGLANHQPGSSLHTSSSPFSSSMAALSLDASGVKPAANSGNGVASSPVTISKKKRGIEYKCENCGKIYRHPSCLIKHRWEHTPHWRDTTKYSSPNAQPNSTGRARSGSIGKNTAQANPTLSKHQQVQLLEAAAILSHLSTSLPEDRGMWPGLVSGTFSESSSYDQEQMKVGDQDQSRASSRSYTPGPRLHDYALSGVTRVAPGLVAVAASSVPKSYYRSSPGSYPGFKVEVKEEEEEDFEMDEDMGDDDNPSSFDGSSSAPSSFNLSSTSLSSTSSLVRQSLARQSEMGYRKAEYGSGFEGSFEHSGYPPESGIRVWDGEMDMDMD
ncbi:hypothetical protein C8J56DRAFT_1042414 [Mycena floridula]|nr:hypothetical protein C8J56DRAFT_1042414 [Mycena floridula]